jgi:ribonuclease-3
MPLHTDEVPGIRCQVPNPASFTGLERKIGFHFRDHSLLAQALTHRSAARESRAHGNNERLEFLGDAVLELAVTEFLFSTSKQPEGELTNWRSALVQRNNLARIARGIQLGDYLFLSRGEEASGGRKKESTLANALEALIGALYLDQGWEVSRRFIDQFILSKLREVLARGEDRDPKSVFQEIAQEKLGITPQYKVLREIGPDHEKVFTVAVYLGSERIAQGSGLSKQRAEQEAAKRALKKKRWEER